MPKIAIVWEKESGEKTQQLFQNLCLRAGIRIEDYIELYLNNKDVRLTLINYKPNLIIGLGNEPLKYFTGNFGITKWRGSILESNVGIKFLPVIDPGKCFKQWTLSHILLVDLKKGKKESEFPELKRKERHFEINPTFDKVITTLQKFTTNSKPLTIDLETYYNVGLIRCLGITDSDNFGICIPFLESHAPYWLEKQEVEIWLALYPLLTSGRMVAQNAQFELSQLSAYTLGNVNIYMCTMRAHGLLYPEFPHSLAFTTSTYTDMVYYKDDGKISDDKGRGFEQLQIYNCRDIVATHEVFEEETKELKEIGLYNFYHEFEAPLTMTLWKMQERGVKIDLDLLKKEQERVGHLRYKGPKLIEKMGELEQLDKELTELVGFQLNVKSNKQMIAFIKSIGLKPKKVTKKRKDGTTYRAETADEQAMEDLYKANPDIPALSKVMEVRRLRTLRETFLELKLTVDGRLTTNYGITETGRLSSKENLFGIGANLQNIPKRRGKFIRRLFIPDKGKVLIKADLSQAEARVVAWLARDINYINMFKSGKDIHTLYASLIFGQSYESITETLRDKAKILRHAKNYNMGPRTMAISLGITMKEAKYLIAEDDKLFPNIKGVFYANAEEQLRKNRTLTTPFGRKRTFFDRWSNNMLREAYAYIPQSTVADYINRAMIKLDYCLPKEANLLAQIHDEILLQCYPYQVEEVYKLLKKHTEIEIIVGGEPLIIPLDVEIGPNWADVIDYKEWLNEKNNTN